MRLTNEEKLIKEFYNVICREDITEEELYMEAMSFAQNYVDEVKKNTRFEEDKIVVDEENRDVYGSMHTKDKGENSKLTINFNYVLHDSHNIKDKNGNKKKIRYGIAEKDSKARFRGFREFIDTLNHETEHFFQSKYAEEFSITEKGMSFSDMMKVLRENAALETEPKKFYRENYGDVFVENDANRVGSFKTASQLFRIFPDMSREQVQIVYSNMIDTLKERTDDMGKIKFDNGKLYDRENVLSAYTDEYIARNPQVLQKSGYEALLQEYHHDGRRRTFLEVMNYKDQILQKIEDNNKFTDETKKEMLRTTKSGYGRIMYNSLIRCSKDDLVDIRKVIGDDRFADEVVFIYKGIMDEYKQKGEELKEFQEFIKENKERFSPAQYENLQEAAKKAIKKVMPIKSFTDDGEPYLNFEDSESLTRIIDLARDADANPVEQIQTRSQRVEAIARLEESSKKYKDKCVERNKQRDERHKIEKIEDDKKEKEEQIKREQQEQQERIEYSAKKREYKAKMRNPFFRMKQFFLKTFAPKSKYLLEEPQMPDHMKPNIKLSRKDIEQKRNQKAGLKKEFEEKSLKLEQAKEDVVPLIAKVRSKQLLERENMVPQEIETQNKENIGG